VAAAASDVVLDEAIEVVEAGVTAGLVAEDGEIAGRYRFSHVLVRDAVYEEIGGLKQARLHGRVAEALSDRDDGSLRMVSELAHHLFLAAPVIGPASGIGAAIRASIAARAALSYEQAELYLHQALALAAIMPRGVERDRQELQLQLHLRLGFLISETRGHTWPEVAQAFDRARRLCVGAGVTADHLRTLWGQFAVAYMAGKLEDAALVGGQLLDLGRESDDPRCELAGLIAVGTAEFYLGRLAKARDHLAGATAIADSLADPTLVDLYHQDPRVFSRSVLVNAIWLLGDYAEAIVAGQTRRIQLLDDPRSTLLALLSKGWLRFLQGDAERLEEGAVVLRRLAADIGYQPMVLAADMHRGWAMARQGATQAGAALLRRTLAALDAARLVALRPCLLGMLAEAEMLDRRPEAALATVDAALEEVNRRGDRFYLPELHRLKGEMLRASGLEGGDLARACFRQALAEAKAQGAVPFRERAEQSLARVSAIA